MRPSIVNTAMIQPFSREGARVFEQRRHPRKVLQLAVQIHLAEGKVIEGVTRDLGVGGAFHLLVQVAAVLASRSSLPSSCPISAQRSCRRLFGGAVLRE
ncbi:MAG: hypothetical protein U0165_16365 [Polyangiaceae bacterium]